MAQVSGQSCGKAPRTTLASTEIFSVGAGIGNSAILRRSGPRDGKRPEAHAQHLADPVVGVVCRGDRPAHGKKSVYLPLEALVGYGNAGLRKTLGVGFAFVEERIETGGDDIRGRQPRVIPRAQRSSAPVGTGSVTAQIGSLISEQPFERSRIGPRATT